jgi:hypothetical protein
MAIIATAGGDSATFTPAPEGVHQAVCVDVIDKGMVETKGFDGKPPRKKHMVSIAWQIDEVRDDGKRFLVYRRYTLSLNEKASLRKDLESWRGRKFTRDEEMGFDVEKLIGVNCMLNIQHNQSGEKTYANVVSVMPLHKSLASTKLAPLDYVRDEAQQAAETDAASNSHDEPPPHDDLDNVPF